MPAQALQKELDAAVHQGIFPGASLLVARGPEILCSLHSGQAQTTPTSRAISENTLFDIASITKPMATATLMMLANPEIDHLVDHPVGDFYHSALYGEIQLKYLLNHTSGLPAWRDYYRQMVQEAPDHNKNTQKILSLIVKEIPHSKPGMKCEYSDLGYILLGYILEQIYAKPLNLIFKEKIAQPLGLVSTKYIPLGETLNDHEIASTEDCPWRKKVLTGEVHDDHAWLMGGVAGHAGLFSTTKDIHRWIVELIKAKKGASDFIDQQTFQFFNPLPEKRDRHKRYFTMGFDTPSEPSSSGKFFSSKTLGHLGYTGTSFWWDTTNDAIVILLTNRVHPSRTNEQIKAFRPKLHNLIWQSYFK